MQGENERQWKKVNENTHDISSIKRVTKGDVTRYDSQRRFLAQDRVAMLE